MARIKQTNIKMTLAKSQAEIEMLPYITAEVAQMTEAAVLAYADIDMQKASEADGRGKEAQRDSVQFRTMPVAAMTAIKHDTVKAMVVSIDGESYGGDKDALFDELKTLPASDFDEIMNKIEELQAEAATDPKDAQK